MMGMWDTQFLEEEKNETMLLESRTLVLLEQGRLWEMGEDRHLQEFLGGRTLVLLE